MAGLPEYNAEGACPKCGMTPGENTASWGPIATEYCNGAGGVCRLAAGEHLHRRCSRCGYQWAEACVGPNGK